MPPPQDWQERVTVDQLGTTALGAEHLARYLFAAHWAAGRLVADVCCGVGYGAYLLAGAGAKAVVGVDIAAEVIAEACRRYVDPRLHFEEADVTRDLPFDAAELIVCFEGIEHVDDPDSLLTLIHSRLGRNGVLIVSTPNSAHSPGGHSGNPHHRHEFSFDEFHALLSQRFSNVRMFFQWRAGDPYDVRWNVRQLARALVPVRVKSRLRGRAPLLADRAESLSHDKTEVFRYRPLPYAYLATLPGFRYETPRVWLAVCNRPRAL